MTRLTAPGESEFDCRGGQRSLDPFAPGWPLERRFIAAKDARTPHCVEGFARKTVTVARGPLRGVHHVVSSRHRPAGRRLVTKFYRDVEAVTMMEKYHGKIAARASPAGRRGSADHRAGPATVGSPLSTYWGPAAADPLRTLAAGQSLAECYGVFPTPPGEFQCCRPTSGSLSYQWCCRPEPDPRGRDDGKGR